MRKFTSPALTASQPALHVPSALLFGLLALIVCGGCASPEPEVDFTGDEAFRTTDPSRLFFNNVRSSSYYLERPRGTDLELYRNRKFSQTVKRPILVPIIVNAWLKHEAYLFVRPNDFPELHSPLTVQWRTDSTAGHYVLDVPSRPAQYEFASRLYGSVRSGHPLAVMLRDSSYVPVFEQRAERAAFLATVRDYYRLTERI